MKLQFETTTNRSYLVVPAANEPQSVADRMLLEARWLQALPCELRHPDGKHYFYYETTHLQSMDIVFQKKKLETEDIRMYLEGWRDATEELRDRFCRDDQLLLQPEGVFYDWEHRRFRFAVMPTDYHEADEAHREMAEFLIAHVDYENRAAKQLAYEIYADTLQGVCYPEKYLRELDEEPGEVLPTAEVKTLVPECREDIFRAEEVAASPAGRDADPPGWRRLLRTWILRILVVSVIGYVIVVFTGLDYIAYAALILASAAGFVLYDRYRAQRGPGEEAAEVPEPSGHLIEAYQVKDTGAAEPVEAVAEDWNPTVYMELDRKEEHRLYRLGHREGESIELEQFPFTIGKAKEYADYQLKDESVSRIHARFYEEEDTIYAEDLGSTNGTFLNGLRLIPKQRVALSAEDEISFGRLSFVYR